MCFEEKTNELPFDALTIRIVDLLVLYTVYCNNCLFYSIDWWTHALSCGVAYVKNISNLPTRTQALITLQHDILTLIITEYIYIKLWYD